METLQYKVIKTDSQYNKYCDILEALVDSGKKTKAVQDEKELLTLLIEKYDEENNTFNDVAPIELLKGLMKEHKMKAVDLAKLLHVSAGLVSDMLNYKKGLSKETIRILSERFKLNQEAFNRPYNLKVPVVSRTLNSRMRNTHRNRTTA
jgi:HTH-type transcriptional regulator/antitoxin HigA